MTDTQFDAQDAEPTPPHLAVNLEAIRAPYLTSLQRTLNVLAVSQAAISRVTEAEYSTYGKSGVLSVNPANAAQLSLLEAKEEAAAWHLRNAFRDAIDVTGLFLDRVRDAAAIARAPKAGTLTRGTLHNLLTTEATEFSKLGIAKKVQILREDLGLELHFYQHIFSINRIRNCLVHRLGVVSQVDVDGNDELRFTYRALEFFFLEPNGTETVIDQPNLAGPAGAAVMMRALDRTRVFHVGERIVLTPEEVTQLFAMLMQFCVTAIGELVTLIPTAPIHSVPPASGADSSGTGKPTS